MTIEKGDTDRCQVLLGTIREAARGSDGRGPQEIVNLNAPIRGERSLIHLAAFHGQVAILKMLLEANADPNRLDGQNRTPLHHAVQSRHGVHQMPPDCANCVATLLQYKADPCIASGQDGTTPLEAARRMGCASCVRTIENHVKIWQGWVDHYEKKLGFIPYWQPVWMVLLLDRRPNTGANWQQGGASILCAACNRTQPPPANVPKFRCRHCQTEILVCPSLTLTLYKVNYTPQSSIIPSETQPSIVQVLPPFANMIQVRTLEEASVNSAADALKRGEFKRALQNSLSSDRAHGFSLKLIGAKGTVLVEHSFRCQSDEDRAVLLRTLTQPTQTAYEADYALQCAATPVRRDSRVQAQAPPPPPPPAVTPSPEVEALRAEQAFIAYGPSSKTGHYSLTPSAAAPAAAGLPGPEVSAASSSSFAGAAAAQVGDEATGEQGEESDLCTVCLDQKADTAVVPCGHLCGCHQCLQAVKASPSPMCPMCRGPVTAVIRIFRS